MRHLQRENGFVFYDFLLSLLIFAVALFGLAEVFTRAKTENAKGRMMSHAVTAGTQRIEDIKTSAKTAATFDTILPENWQQVSASPLLHQKVEVVDNSPTLKTVKVHTAWNNQRNEVILETMVAK